MYSLVIAYALSGLSAAADPPAPPAWVLEVGMSAAQTRAKTDAYSKRGYQPACISAYNSVEDNRYAVIYKQGKGPKWEMDWGQTPERFLARSRDLQAKGFVSVCVSGCNEVGAQRLSDLWVQERGPVREAQYGMDANSLLRQTGKMKARGYRPVWLSSYMVNTFNTYAVIWDKGGEDWEMKYGITAQALQETTDDLSALGYRPLSVAGLNSGGVVRYSAVWMKRKGPAWDMRYGQTQEGQLDLARTMAARGYHPVSVTGFNTLEGDRFASIWEKDAPAK